MGAAGKRREEELLAKITTLETTVRERDNQISDYEGQLAGLREQIKMKEADIDQLESKIAELVAKIQ